MIRLVVRILLSLLLAIAVIVNARLYGGTDSEDAVAQLHHLRKSLDAGAGSEMQGLFPEGYFFMYALYGAAWIEVGREAPPGSERRSEARVEVKWALEKLDSPAGRAPFPENFEPVRGVFFAGWTNWLRGGLLSLYAEDERPADEWRLFTEQSTNLADAFAKSDTPFLQSYAGRSWPVDNVVAMASLRLHDRLAPARFEATLARWRSQVQGRLDPATGLIPHSADPTTGMPKEGARGSSQALLLRFLMEIDPELGRAQYLSFRTQYVAPGWLLPGTREYPVGTEGRADSDSGPLIQGVSLSASVVSIAPARLVADDELTGPYQHLGEVLGLPVEWQGRRRYLFGQLPIADAFLVYARTATVWNDRPPPVATDRIVPWGWRLGWHILTLGPLAFALWLTKVRRKEIKQPLT